MSERLEELSEERLPSEVQTYIDRAIGSIKSRGRRREVERELRSHAFDVLEELRSMGLGDQEAADEIVRRLGDVMGLSSLLGEANRTPVERWIMRVSAALLLLVTGGMTVLLMTRTLDLIEREKEYTQDLREKYPAFAQVQSERSKESIYASPHGQRDAGELLNEVLQWEKDEPGPKRLGLSDEVSARVQKAFANAKKLNIEDLKKVDISGLDLTWMSKLKDYDLWDLHASGKGKRKLEESLAAHRFIPAFPNMIDVLTLARARFAQGVQARQVREALNDIEELGRLMMTTEILLPYMIGVSFYYTYLPRFETLAMTAGLLKGAARYHAMEDLDVRMASRTLYAFLSNFFTPKEYLEGYLRHPEWSIGRCAAINEMIYAMHASEVYFAPAPWPFERDFTQVMDLRKRIIEQSKDKCRLTWYRAGGLQNARVSLSDLSSDGGNALSKFLMTVTTKLPYARRIVGLSVNGVLTTAP